MYGFVSYSVHLALSQEHVLMPLNIYMYFPLNYREYFKLRNNAS